MATAITLVSGAIALGAAALGCFVLSTERKRRARAREVARGRWGRARPSE